ncbi:type II CAAX endopeptidase family protein [Pinirhizobacter sp.]|jgi:membrane protease YdiL (CAAX protease family)|uniref:CPBP family intramembrane glutamic endopeptidase n=1 Tax=Pinirhizobacter sp. TaxID=2950432 RepID=UPI002F41AEEB
MGPTSRRVLAAALFVAAAALALTLLPGLSTWLTWRELAQTAQADAASWNRQASPWHWTVRRPEDLVAGRVFGEVRQAMSPDGLVLRSEESTPFEMGLPLARTADLIHAGRLHILMKPESPVAVQLVVRERLDGPAFVSGPVIGATDLALDTPSLSWTADGHPSMAPTRAAMLRLRLQLQPGKSVVFSGASLEPMVPVSPPMPGTPPRTHSLGAWIDAASHLDARQIPWLVPTASLRAENLLHWRDRARDAIPAAIVGSGAPHPGLPGWASQRLAAGLVIFYVLGLIWLWRRQPTRPGLTAGLETAGLLAGPLWLVAGLHFGTADIPLPAVACVAALVFGALLAWRDRHAPYGLRPANGTERWLTPLLLLSVAIVLAIGSGRTWTAPDPLRALSYIAWAFVQQWLLLSLVGRRLHRLLPPAAAMFVTALSFALLHTPNGALMQMCFIGELWWAWCYYRGRSLVPIAVAHAACALILEAALAGGPYLRSLEVSARFFL